MTTRCCAGCLCWRRAALYPHPHRCRCRWPPLTAAAFPAGRPDCAHCPQVQMERSLFERLQQQGAPVKMLSVQYRMHPAIRQVGAACAGMRPPGAGGGWLVASSAWQLAAASATLMCSPLAPLPAVPALPLPLPPAVPLPALLRRPAARRRRDPRHPARPLLCAPPHEALRLFRCRQGAGAAARGRRQPEQQGGWGRPAAGEALGGQQGTGLAALVQHRSPCVVPSVHRALLRCWCCRRCRLRR